MTFSSHPFLLDGVLKQAEDKEVFDLKFCEDHSEVLKFMKMAKLDPLISDILSISSLTSVSSLTQLVPVDNDADVAVQPATLYVRDFY